MMLIAGLGNPGLEYSKTRHNVGFMVVERVAAQAGAAGAGLPVRWRLKCRALVAETYFQGQKAILARPQTYMNNSGEAVGPLLRWYGLSPAELLVVCDDLDLPPGRIRIRKKGGDGGHRGLKSIIAVLGTNEFIRLRIGIGRPEQPEQDVVRWVLGRFQAPEASSVEEALTKAVQAVRTILGAGVEQAMNQFN